MTVPWSVAITERAIKWADSRAALLEFPDSGDRKEYRRLLNTLSECESDLYLASRSGPHYFMRGVEMVSGDLGVA